MLIRAKLPTDKNPEQREPIRKGNCKNKNCRYCPKINRIGHISNNRKSKNYWTYTNVNCESNNLVYCIECQICKIKYVGQTGNTIKERFRNHFYLISKKSDSHQVSKHFNSAGHNGLADISIHILGLIYETPGTTKARRRRLEKEGFWQQRLNTLRPHGLNTLDET